MKKIVAVIGVLALFVGAVVVLLTVDFNRFGKDHVYVEVIEPTDITEDKLDNGEIMTRYWYNQTAYNEKGKAVTVEFSAFRELRQGAYLMLYVKKGNEVTSFDEVQWKEIPSEAQTKLKAENASL
ncbi:YxeA family protein [Lederbergia sp. NSJ-179]|uniref:YxeA family protein n=1 Tax=Lederbergia sp. NSJ-179 TaxID=2931402 RepID=UPI001FD1FC17|nr:YxeA family protein [Lederbergia sp. NSJ-179]MCJ7841900.1 YxeA family protein [Lederbergia sp. NSJ-179]